MSNQQTASIKIDSEFSAGGKLYRVWNINGQMIHSGRVGKSGQMLSSANRHNHLNLSFDRFDELVKMGAIS